MVYVKDTFQCFLRGNTNIESSYLGKVLTLFVKISVEIPPAWICPLPILFLR